MIGLLSAVPAAEAQVPNRYRTAEADLPCVDQTLTLRIHLVDDEDGSPQTIDTVAFDSLLGVVNGWFAPICLGFEVCEYRRVENYRYASFERNDSTETAVLFGDRNRIDVFLVSRDSLFRPGIGTVEGASAEFRPEASVAVVRDDAERDAVHLAHQLGHYFGLRNTYARVGGQELVNGENCAEAGDLICDTPADPYVENANVQWTDPADPCRFVFRGRDENGQFYVPDTGNVMSRYPAQCACGFTHDQLARMAAAFLANRAGLY